MGNSAFNYEDAETSQVATKYFPDARSALVETGRLAKHKGGTSSLFPRGCLGVGTSSDVLKQWLPADSSLTRDFLNFILIVPKLASEQDALAVGVYQLGSAKLVPYGGRHIAHS